jgi:hypothetical protein
LALVNYNILIEKLDEFIRKYYKNKIIKGLLYCLAFIPAFYLVLAITEYFGNFNTFVRGVLFFSLITSSLFIFVRMVILPFINLNKLGKIISHEQASSIIGNHFVDVKDKLINTLQLKKLSDHSQNNNELLVAGITQKINELKPVPFVGAIDFNQNKKYLKYALPPLLLIAILLFAAPSVLREGTERLVGYDRTFEKKAPFQFQVLNKNLEVSSLEDYELKVELNGTIIPENATINIDGASYRLKKEDRFHFNHVFKNVQKNISFFLEADGFTSKEYLLKSIPSPFILNFAVNLKYPAYTNKASETLKNTGNLIVPEGSIAEWVVGTENTNNVNFQFSDTILSISSSSAGQFKFVKKLFRSENYSLVPSNQFLKGKEAIAYGITVVPDLYPSIEIEEKKDSLNTKNIYFRGIIKDDYGFKKLSFNYYFTDKKDSSGTENKSNIISIPINASLQQEQFYHAWNLNELKIQAGDEINYYFEVFDNDGVHGSKSTKSKISVFKAPSLDELDKNNEANNQELKDQIEQSIKDAQSLKKEIAEMNKTLLEKPNLNWQEKKKLEDLLNKQKNLEQKVNQIKNDNKQNNQEQSDYKQESQEILDKQEQLEKLFDEVMTDEMKELYKQLEEMLEKLDKDKIQEQLEKINLSNEEVKKELDRSLELFKQLEFEKKMTDTIEKLKKLSEEQQKLGDETKENKSPNNELKKEQVELDKKFEEVKDDLKALEEKNKELEEPNKMENTDQDQNEIDEKMQETKEQLENKKNNKASESQKSAAEKMKKLGEKMQAMQQEQQQESAEENAEDLRALLENIIQLSFDQEKLMDNLKTISTNDPKYVKQGQEQKKLKDDAKMIEDSLFALSKRVADLESIVNKEIGQINYNMLSAIEQIAERRTAGATSNQQYAMTSLNNLALLLDEALQQMQQQMANAKPGSGSCDKPGGKGAKPSMGSMKKMQEGMNKKLEQLKKAMEEGGGKPGAKPGKGDQGMSKELAKTAAEQSALRKEIEKLAQQLNEEGKGAGNELKKIATEMEKTEKDIVNKNITRETIKRQQDIVTRLLESEKAEREREYDNKRKSNEAKNYPVSNPAEYFKYNTKKQNEAELLKTLPPALKPYYKTKVNEYFIKFEN